MAQAVFPLLVCPVTKQRLLPVTGKRAELLDSALEKGELRYVDGTSMEITPERVVFLITENTHHLYTVVDDVPLMLESRQVDIRSLNLSLAK